MSFQTTLITILIVGLLIHILMIVLVKRVKETTRKGLGASLMIVVPNVLMQAALTYFSLYNSTIQPPKPFDDQKTIQTLEDAEKRIQQLEGYSRQVEIYLDYSRRQFFLLVAAMGLFYSIPLFFIALSLAKTKEPEIEKDKDFEEVK